MSDELTDYVVSHFPPDALTWFEQKGVRNYLWCNAPLRTAEPRLGDLAPAQGR
jgi:hypothetical protein